MFYPTLGAIFLILLTVMILYASISINRFVYKGICFFYEGAGLESGYWAVLEAELQSNGKTSDDGFSFNKLHVLKDGDYLTIFSKDDPRKLVWSGTIKLSHYPLVTQGDSSWGSRSEQKGVVLEVWAKWFAEEYPAVLVSKPSKKI